MEDTPSNAAMEMTEPCNVGCSWGDFEATFTPDYGHVIKEVCSNSPGNPLFPTIGWPCMRTNNKSPDKYWASVNHELAANSFETSYNSNLTISGEECVAFMANISCRSTVDVITTDPVAYPYEDYGSANQGNPDDTWDPLNEANQHYVRFVTTDGYKVLDPVTECGVSYRNYNDMTESIKFSRSSSSTNTSHPQLIEGTTYVVEFYTACYGRLEQADGTELPLPLNNQFNLRYFVGPTIMDMSDEACDDFPSYIEYAVTPGGVAFNTGRFISGANCTPNFTHNYGTNQEVWQHLSQTFTPTVSAAHAVFLSPITENYHNGFQFEQALYFLDDLFITPISENPISALLSVQGNYGPIINWNGFYQIPLSVFVQTDWIGANSQPVTVQLNLPPGLSVATTGWSNNTYTFQTGTLNNAGTTLNIMLNISSAYNPNNENEISLTTGANTVSGCLNHVPRIALNMMCTPPAVTFASYGYCNTPSIVASVVPVAGVTGTYTQVWDGPGTYAATGLTALNPVSGAYILTLSNGACSQNYTYSYSAPANATTWVGNTTINNETAFDLSSQVVVAQGDIYIEPTYTWNVNATTIYLQPNKRIQVKANGNVVANKGTFTAACPTMWKGFEVQGNDNAPEVWSTNLIASPHGTVELSECTVSRAICGIFANRYNTTNPLDINSDSYTVAGELDNTSPAGGLIRITGPTLFLNNRQDLYFGKTSLAGGNRVSRIAGTTFQIDQSYIGLPPFSRIELANNVGIRFGDFDLLNLNPNFVLSINAFTGIKMTNAKCEILCNVNNNFATTGADNKIEGFTYGVSIDGTLLTIGTPNQKQKVYNTKFKCHRGSYCRGNTNLSTEFIGNTFQFLPEGFTTAPLYNSQLTNWNNYAGNVVAGRYGAYFYGGFSSIIFKQNTIIGSFDLDALNAVGLIVNHTGTNTTNYTLNTFSNLSHGISFYGVNRNTIDAGIGARFSCNTFTANGKDVIVSRLPNPFSNSPASQSSGLGIALSQGSQTTSAGNKFSQNTLQLFDDLDQMDNVIQGHTYYYKNGGTQENLVVTESNFTEFESLTPNLCFGSNGSTLPTTILLYNNLVTQYQIIKDGGNTPTTVQEIKEATSSGALELYYDLLAKSPNLSEEAIAELVLKEYELSNNLLTLILANNPAAAKSEEIKEQLENKMIPLEEWQMQLIMAAELWNSDLDNLKAEMSDALSTYYQLQIKQEDVIRATVEDPTLAYTELLSLYDPSFHPMDWLHIAAIHAQYGNSTERVLALKQFEQSNLCDTQMYNDIETMLNLETRLAAWQPNDPQTDPTLLDDLQSTCTNALIPWSSALACAGIELLTGEIFLEPLFNDGVTRSEQLPKPRAVIGSIDQALLVANPNPTNDFAMITLPAGFEQLNLKLQIYNTIGSLVHELVLSEQLTFIDCSNFANGLYTMRVAVSNQLVMTGKLIKQ